MGGFLRGVLGRRGASGADREGAEEELARAKKELKQTKRALERTRRDLKQKRRQLKRTARANVLLRVPEGSVCAEIGVDEGVFSRQILDTVSPRRLHLIDPWKHHDEDEYRRSRYGGLGPGGQGIMDERYEEVRARFAEEVQAGRVTFHRNFSNEIADEFEDSYFDWVYVDGNHHYEFVRQDLKLYYPKVKPGGFIAGDDYGSRGWWDNGVQKAVDEFVSQRPDLTLEVHGTQFVIQKPERASPADEPVKADLALREIAQRTGKMPEGRLPDFLLIGAQKCGTGFLFRLLSQHPRVEPAVIKEVGFFSNHFEKGLEWYRSCFPAPAHEDGRPVWTWEASPNDLFYPHAPRRAAEIVPRAKLIALLRNPVDRAYSHFHHQVRMGHEPLSSFEAALEAEEKRLRGKRERMLQDERYSSVNFPRFSYVSRGLYADRLREWYEYFGRDQLLVIKSEDLFERPREIVAQIVGFLGLPEWEPGTVTPPRTKYHNEPMSLATRQRLEEYFEPHNRRLYELLGRDFGW